MLQAMIVPEKQNNKGIISWSILPIKSLNLNEKTSPDSNAIDDDDTLSRNPAHI